MTNRTKIGIIFAVVVIAILGYGYLSQGNGQDVPAAQSTEKSGKQVQEYPAAPDFTLNDLDGKAVSLSEYRGKVVVIDFWATWCPPCRKGIPDFVEMQEEYGRDKFIVLGINLDQGTPDKVLPMVKDFAQNYKINYPVLMHDQSIVFAYGGIQSIPTTFIVDQNGKVRQGVVGYRPKEYFRNIIEALL